MPPVKISSLPIDRGTVEELKEKLLGLKDENEDENKNGELSENGYLSNDEGMNDMGEPNDGLSTFTEVALLLDGMGMGKYIKTFKKENIDLNTFLNLTEKDLEELGISKKKDRKIIVNNLGDQKEPSDEFIVEENHTNDYQIIKNVQNHLTLIQNYCGYVECEMKKRRLVDYNITSSKTALTFLTQFAEAGIKQTKIISKLLFQENSSNHIIGKLLEANKLELPEELQEKLITKEIKKRKYPTYSIGIIGLTVVLVYAAKKLLKKIIS